MNGRGKGLMPWKWWRKRQRRTDLEILWPVCLSEAPDIDKAKAAFAVHVFNDAAWCQDFTHAQLVDFVERLGPK